MWIQNLTELIFPRNFSPSESDLSEWLNEPGFTATKNPIHCEKFCAQLKVLGESYNKVHGYLSLVVCVFGVIANLLNGFIFSRPAMKNSTNLILTALAVSDLCKLVEYIPYAIYSDFLPSGEISWEGTSRKTYAWACYVFFHSNFSLFCHTVSIWLTVLLAGWRYVMISTPLQSRTMCSLARARVMIGLVCGVSVVLCGPFFVMFSVQTVPLLSPWGTFPWTLIYNKTSELDGFNRSANGGMTTTSFPFFLVPQSTEKAYVVNFSTFTDSHPAIVNVNLWVYSIVHKIIPCLLNSISSFRLIVSLWRAKRRKEMLRVPPPPPPPSTIISPCSPEPLSSASYLQVPSGLPEIIPLNNLVPPRDPPGIRPSPPTTLSIRPPPSDVTIESEQTSMFCGNISARPSSSTATTPCTDSYLTSRTTLMLLIVLILFLITELPQGLLALLSAIDGKPFFIRCYNSVANLLDILALLNCSLNIVPYTIMNKRFRAALVYLLRRCSLRRLT